LWHNRSRLQVAREVYVDFISRWVARNAQREAVDKVSEILRPDAPKSGSGGEWIQ
jgi:hypothetical protein